MSAKRDPQIYIEDILESINLILEYSESAAKETIEKSQEKKDAILLRFEIIGEAALQLPQEFKDKYPLIAWRSMADMRNKIIHEYFGWNWHIIWQTIQEDLPVLKKQIQKILKDIEEK